MINNGKIEICPLAFMRGRTFKHSFIIADEMQNSSPNQMKMLATRLGTNTRMVITGDLNQSDITKENGLQDFISKIEEYNDTELIKFIKLESDDIERSEIVKKVIDIYDYKKENVKQSENKNINNISKTKTINLYNKNNDAALIPKHHITHNFDIFFESRDF
jgi:phosphate starvation-inducible protein PhoH